jgi:hypothetical protein
MNNDIFYNYDYILSISRSITKNGRIYVTKISKRYDEYEKQNLRIKKLKRILDV